MTQTSPITQRSSLAQDKVAVLADLITSRMTNTAPGHCARVDYLTHDTARDLCAYLRASSTTDTSGIATSGIAGSLIAYYILAPSTVSAPDDEGHNLYLTTDQAVELRNRKQGRLCLFIPANQVDAINSSLTNSFESIDGRTLYADARKRLLDRLTRDDKEAAHVAREVFRRVRHPLEATDEQRLDFLQIAQRLNRSGKLETLGKYLWRVGLLPDEFPEFAKAEWLDRNRMCMLRLTRPTTLHSTARDRIQQLGVDADTRKLLLTFFQHYNLADATVWLRALAKDPALTFDQWSFPKEDRSDLTDVTVTSFMKQGVVEKYCRLTQPNGKDGDLIAECGPKKTIVVRWKTTPAKPNNLIRWRVEVVRADSEPGEEAGDGLEDDQELPSREVPASRGTATLDFSMNADAFPDTYYCVRITPLDSLGMPIVADAGDHLSGGASSDTGVRPTGQPIFADSEPFYLGEASATPEPTPGRNRRLTVPSIAFGRLALALREDAELVEDHAQWASQADGMDYFTVNLLPKQTASIGASGLLRALEQRTLEQPRNGGCYRLQGREVALAIETDINDVALPAQSDAWTNFWNARANFFELIVKGESNRTTIATAKGEPNRKSIATANWTPRLADSALRYAGAYRKLLDDLATQPASDEELRAALAVDTLLIQVGYGAGRAEEAVVIAPTHPLRAAWMASYTQLLSKWEEQLREIKKPLRQRNLDLVKLRLVAPANAPAFGFHSQTTTPFVFFRNLLFYHGVALPADAPDPQRRFADLCAILGATNDADLGDSSSASLSEQLRRFCALHPYTETLVTTLVNPDRGELFAGAVEEWLTTPTVNQDDENEPPAPPPLLQIDAYAEDPQRAQLLAFANVRKRQAESQLSGSADTFTPGLAVTLRAMSDLRLHGAPDAHLAVVADFTRPAITVADESDVTSDGTGSVAESAVNAGSFALYGLLARFIPQTLRRDDTFIWRYRIVTEAPAKVETHPAREGYTNALIETHTSLLNAGGRLLRAAGRGATNGAPTSAASPAHTLRPALDVTLDSERQRMLNELHRSASWVISLDRFFALDYYDSPHTADLDEIAQTYVLDYTPGFTEGLGHRMMVTTAWRDELRVLLGQTMEAHGLPASAQSAQGLLAHIKTLSGRLALQTLASDEDRTAGLGLGLVTAWLKNQHRLEQSLLIPVRDHPQLFDVADQPMVRASQQPAQLCDLALLSFKRGIVEATFIAVRWRRGAELLDDIAEELERQTQGTAHALDQRCFAEGRVDGALQRSHLANVLRFYFERARRYHLLNDDALKSIPERLAQLEKSGLNFRPSAEGFILDLNGEPHHDLILGDTKVRVFTAHNLVDIPDLQPTRPSGQTPESAQDESAINDEMASDEMANGAATAWSSVSDNTDADASQPDAPLATHTAQPPDASGIAEPPEGYTSAGAEIASEATDATPTPPATAEISVRLGEAKGSPVDWLPSVQGSPHLFIIGIPGQGKSVTINNIITSLSEQSVAPLVLDFHGQFAAEATRAPSSTQPVIVDAAEGLPFSPFEFVRTAKNGWQHNSYELAEIIGYVADLGEIQQDAVMRAVRDSYREQGFSEADMGVELALPTLEDVLKKLQRMEQTKQATNVVARCRRLLEMDLFRPIDGTPELVSLMRQGMIIDLHHLYGEMLQLAAGAFVLQKLYKDMFRWGSTDRLRLVIVLDEAHRLARDVTLPRIMKEGRKYGVAVVVASQGMNDFHQDVLGNAGTKVIFRVNYPESKKIAGFIHARQGQDLQARIEGLHVGQAIVQTPEMPFGELTIMDDLRA